MSKWIGLYDLLNRLDAAQWQEAAQAARESPIHFRMWAGAIAQGLGTDPVLVNVAGLGIMQQFFAAPRVCRIHQQAASLVRAVAEEMASAAPPTPPDLFDRPVVLESVRPESTLTLQTSAIGIYAVPSANEDDGADDWFVVGLDYPDEAYVGHWQYNSREAWDTSPLIPTQERERLSAT